MASSEIWLQVLSLAKALFDAIKSGEDVAQSYQKHRKEQATIEESRRVSRVFTTYSEGEVSAILSRLEQCRDRFIQQGGGADRARCFCSIFDEVKKGNGGRLPLIDDWNRMYRELRCNEETD